MVKLEHDRDLTFSPMINQNSKKILEKSDRQSTSQILNISNISKKRSKSRKNIH